MPIYAFETIAPAEALSIGPSDGLTISRSTGLATDASVVYNLDSAGRTIGIALTIGARTVVFGPGLAALSQQSGHMIFSDASALYIGGDGADSFNNAPAGLNGWTAAYGGGGADTLIAGGLHNVLQGNAGNDILVGGDGDDTLYGGQGDDQIILGLGVNFGQGNRGDDTITGSLVATARDTLLGGQGDDRLSGAGVLNGNLGNDSITGAGQLFGEGGNDTLVSSSPTTLATGHDTLSGGDGDDSIQAGSGADSISGDAGNDTIVATAGAHVVAGGAGADRFMFGANSLTAGAVTQILDWSQSDDRIRFLGLAPAAADVTSGSSATYATALTLASDTVSHTHFVVMDVQVGADLYVFAGGPGGVSSVVELVGRTLQDFTGQSLF